MGAQADKKKRKKKRKKKEIDPEVRRKKMITIFTAILVVLLAFFLLLLLFRVKKVEVTGNRHNTDYEIRQVAMNGPMSANVLYLTIFGRHPKAENMPFVDHISIEYLDRHTVRILVSEIEATGCTEHEGLYYYFNENGVVQLCTDHLMYSGDLTEEEMAQITQSSDDQPRDVFYIPLVEGLDLTEAGVGEALAVEDPSVFRTISSISGMINKDKVSPDKVILSKDKTWSMICGTIRVLLGKDTHMEEKIEELSGILPEAQGLSGTLHLEDFDGSQNRIIFDKNG